MARQNHAKPQPTKPSPQAAETPKRENAFASRPPPSHDQIAQRAYELYLSRGGDHGRHEEDWNQAERELALGR